MSKPSFKEDCVHFAAFALEIVQKCAELEEALKRIKELEKEVESCHCEECNCEKCCENCECESKSPTIEDLREMARFLVDTEDNIMEINIEVTYKKDEKEDKSADSDDSE